MPQFLHFNNITHKRNKIDEGRRPTVAYRKTRSAQSKLCQEIRWPGGRFVYDPDHPLPCGAVAFIELDDEVAVELVDKAGSFKEALCLKCASKRKKTGRTSKTGSPRGGKPKTN